MWRVIDINRKKAKCRQPINPGKYDEDKTSEFPLGELLNQEGLPPMLQESSAAAKKARGVKPRAKPPRKKRRPQHQPPPIDLAALPTHPDKLLSPREWCALCGISERTGRRIMALGEGPPIVRLSPQRYGIRVADNAKWQASRARKRK